MKVNFQLILINKTACKVWLSADASRFVLFSSFSRFCHSHCVAATRPRLSDENLSEVHDFFGISVYGNGSGQRTGCSVFWAAALVWPLAGIVFLLDQVVSKMNIAQSRSMKIWNLVLPRSECNEMCVVSRRRNGYRSSTSHVCMTQLVG